MPSSLLNVRAGSIDGGSSHVSSKANLLYLGGSGSKLRPLEKV